MEGLYPCLCHPCLLACLSVASLAKSLRSRSQGLPAITGQTNGREWSEACPSLLIMCFIVVLYQLYFWGRSLIKYPTSDFPQFDFNCTALQSLKSSTVTDLCEKKWSKQCWWQGNDHNAANMMFCWVECRRMSEEDVLPPFQLISACCALSAPVECSITWVACALSATCQLHQLSTCYSVISPAIVRCRMCCFFGKNRVSISRIYGGHKVVQSPAT